MDRRSFLSFFGGLAAFLPGASWARGQFKPSGGVNVYSPADLSPDFLGLPPAVTIFEWWDDAAVPSRTIDGVGRSIGARRIHVWTPKMEHALVCFEVPFPGHPDRDTRSVHVPLFDFEGGYEELVERAWEVWEYGKANPVIDERGYHLGDLVWVTVGNRERVRHGIAWIPFADEVFEEGLVSKMHLSLPVEVLRGGVGAVGDKLTQEEKSALTGQAVVGALHIPQLNAITGMEWSDKGGYYEAQGGGVVAYLENDDIRGRWGLSVWAESGELVVPFERKACPYELCRELLAAPRVS